MLNLAFGWWQADPLAGYYAIREARESFFGDR